VGHGLEAGSSEGAGTNTVGGAESSFARIEISAYKASGAGCRTHPEKEEGE